MMDRTIDAFRGTGFDGRKLDIERMKKITSPSAAAQALDLVSNPAFIGQIGKLHSEKEINELKKAVYRAAITHGVALPSRCIVDARMLGVVVP